MSDNLKPSLAQLTTCFDEPSKVAVLMQLAVLGEATVPDISAGISSEIGCEFELIPQTVRYIVNSTLQKANVVDSWTYDGRIRPVYWSLSDTFYGDVAYNSLELMSQTGRSITDFFGRSNRLNSPSEGLSKRALLLKQISEGKCDEIHMTEWVDRLGFHPSVFYGAQRLGLAAKTKRGYAISEDAQMFLQTVFNPLVYAAKTPVLPKSQLRVGGIDLPRLYTSALSKH